MKTEKKDLGTPPDIVAELLRIIREDDLVRSLSLSLRESPAGVIHGISMLREDLAILRRVRIF